MVDEVVLLAGCLFGEPRVDGVERELLDEDEPVVEVGVLLGIRVL